MTGKPSKQAVVNCVTEFDLPVYSTNGSAGADLKARISRIDRQDVTKNIKSGFILRMILYFYIQEEDV